jgi:ATP-dependent helicase/nuclease subunit A
MDAEVRHPETAAMLRDMAGQADFLRPYEFLERVLIDHDGRRRLLARLGREAEDPIDELLAQALAYEAREAPSLAGFIAWIEAGDIKVKREMERGADEIRVMTVHGAKGLEAPVVILPDTMAKGGGGGGRPTLLPAASGANQPPLMLWAGAKADDDPVTRDARAKAEARDAAERKRLLYVALTRAEDWLILCGAGQEGKKANTWYELLERGADTIGGWLEVPGPAGPVWRRDDNPSALTGAPEDGDAEEVAGTPALTRPTWLAKAPREERAKRISPSSLGEHVEDGGAGLGREMALTRGSAVHFLLERLADRPAELRGELAMRLLAHSFPDLPGEIAAGVVVEALAVFDATFADEVFGPDSLAEVGMALALPATAATTMLGRIDRLVIGPARLLVVDFKTDARPATGPGEVPEAYLLQLACYRSALASLYPQHLVEAAVLWTAEPVLMPMDSGVLDHSLAEWNARRP